MRYIILILLAAVPCLAQTSGSAMPFVKPQFFTSTGLPAAGYKVCTYTAGTTTPALTYTTSGLNVANANPVVLDSAGRANIFLAAANYKIALLLPSSTTTNCTNGTQSAVWTEDNIANNEGLVLAALQAYEAVLAGSTGSSLIGFKQSGTGAVTRTVQAKLRESVSVLDFGAVGDDATVNDTAFAAALAADVAVTIPPGTYVLSSPVTITTSGAQILCDNPVTTILKFTGATSGVVFSAAAASIQFGLVSNCQILSTNAGGGTGIYFDGSAHGSNNFTALNNFVTTSGGGNWSVGIKGNQIETSTFQSNRVYGALDTAISIVNSTSVDLIGNRVGAINSPGTDLSVNSNSHSIKDIGSYYQGSGLTQAILVETGCDAMFAQTNIENQGSAGFGLLAQGRASVSGMIGSGNFTRFIRTTVANSNISEVYFNGSASTEIVAINDGTGGGIINSTLVNTHATGGGINISGGTGASATGNDVTTLAGAAVRFQSIGGVISGNNLHSATGYGIDATDNFLARFSYVNNQFFVSDAAHVFNGISATVTLAQVLAHGGNYLSGVGPLFAGTSGSLGGGALLAGACASGTVTVSQSQAGMPVAASPLIYPGDTIYWRAYVSAADTVTVNVCAATASTPTASTYSVLVGP